MYNCMLRQIYTILLEGFYDKSTLLASKAYAQTKPPDSPIQETKTAPNCKSAKVIGKSLSHNEWDSLQDKYLNWHFPIRLVP